MFAIVWVHYITQTKGVPLSFLTDHNKKLHLFPHRPQCQPAIPKMFYFEDKNIEALNSMGPDYQYYVLRGLKSPPSGVLLDYL